MQFTKLNIKSIAQGGGFQMSRYRYEQCPCQTAGYGTYGGGFEGKGFGFSTLIILILIILQFGKGKCGCSYDKVCDQDYDKDYDKDCDYEKDYGYDKKRCKGAVDNGILFIIAIFFLACCGCGRR